MGQSDNFIESVENVRAMNNWLDWSLDTSITKMKVVEEGKPSDADAYQDIVDEIYQEPDPSEPPSLNVGYTTDLADVTVW